MHKRQRRGARRLSSSTYLLKASPAKRTVHDRINGLPACAPYHRVRAYNVLGNSVYSNTASAKTLK